MSARVLIAGCGRLGAGLGVTLANAGHTVFGLRRNPQTLPAAITPIAANLSQPEDLASRLPQGLDRVFYILTPSTYDAPGYQAAYVDGLRHLVAALAENGDHHARLMFVSSTGVYGQSNGEWVDEQSPTEPTRFSGQRLLAAEQITQTHPGTSVCVRFAGIYGPGREALIRRVERGAGCADQPMRMTNRIHEQDCIGILAHISALRNPESVYIGVDNAPCSQCEVMDWLAGELGYPQPPRESSSDAGRRCRNTRLLNSGYALRYPTYREGYQSILTQRRSSA